jgi:hypothetical protein
LPIQDGKDKKEWVATEKSLKSFIRKRAESKSESCFKK